MKTDLEIERKITRLESMLLDSNDEMFKTIVNSQITALKWVLKP